MKINQLRVGSLLSYLQMALNIIIGLIYTPVMIRMLGQSEYGLYNTVVSTISMLSLLSLGFNSSYIRYYSKYKAKDDTESIYKLNGLFMIVFLIIGVVALLCGGFLSFNLNLVFAEGLTAAEYDIAKVLMIMLTFNLAVSFPMSVFTSIISANERYVFLKLLGMVRTVFSPLIIMPLLFMGFRSIGMVTVTVVISLLVDVAYVYYVFKVLKHRFIFHGFEKGIFKDLFGYTVFIAINMVIDQINWNVDKLILGRFKGTEAVAVYSVGYVLYNYYMMFSTSVSSVFTPRIHKLIEENKGDLNEQRTALTDLVIRVGRIQFIILFFVASGVTVFGRYFILNIWAGEGYDYSYYVTLMLMFASLIPLIQNICIEIQRAQNNHKFRSIIYLIMALLNLTASFLLCPKYGVLGCCFATMVSVLLANGLIMNIFYHKRCNIDIFAFWKSILSLCKGVIIPVLLGALLFNFSTNAFVFVVGIIIYSLIYFASMWLFAMNGYEKSLVLAPLKKLIGKKND